MYQNGVLKKFLADCSAKVAASIATAYVEQGGRYSGNVAALQEEKIAEQIANAAVAVAAVLARRLEETWGKGTGHETTFFGIEETEYTVLEKRLDEMTEEIKRLKS